MTDPKRTMLSDGTISARRRLLRFGLVLTGAALMAPIARAQTATAPAAGDALVFHEGAQAGREIRPDDLAIGAAPILAWPMRPGTGIIRRDDPDDQVLLLRLAVDQLGPAVLPWAAAGILAFSAICTHEGCNVTDWDVTRALLRCPCHGSEFDPRAAGDVVFGPAVRSLPVLPLACDDGALRVAAGFIDTVGAG
ncbi:MAG: ubiquinol-cytochrome c reductase iron-sulfur subunit [Azospirillaceae bacterium]|nr:ubiquinol-cytochrome c reductase iron-sulfur subunit [Azospirillaceae bacterium]